MVMLRQARKRKLARRKIRQSKITKQKVIRGEAMKVVGGKTNAKNWISEKSEFAPLDGLHLAAILGDMREEAVEKRDWDVAHKYGRLKTALVLLLRSKNPSIVKATIEKRNGQSLLVVHHKLFTTYRGPHVPLIYLEEFQIVDRLLDDERIKEIRLDEVEKCIDKILCVFN